MLYFSYHGKEILRMETKSRLNTLDLAYVGLAVALIAICSWISIPTAIPFTMQTFAVFAVVGILGMYRGTLAILVYILLGAVGVPVFAGFSGGIGVLFRNTGGYIIGFIFMALITGAIIQMFGKKVWIMAAAMVIGLFVLYAFGTVWFIVVYAGNNGAIGAAAALSWCVVPYIVPDLIKIGLAILLTKRVGKVF